MRLFPFGVADGAANVKAPTTFALGIYRCAEKANSLLRASLGFVATQGFCLATIIIDAGFVNRVARPFLLLNQFWPGISQAAFLNEPCYEERGSSSEPTDKRRLHRATHGFDACVVSFDCSEDEERQQSHRHRGPKRGPDVRH